MKKVLKSVLLALTLALGVNSCSDVDDDCFEKTVEVEYKVEHYKQSVDAKNYILEESDTETARGIVNSKTAAKAKSYEGFSSKNIEQLKISSDGKTTVKVYYDRNEITLSFDFANGKDSEGNESVKISGLYGADITPPNPMRPGFFIASWNPPLPQVFPSENTVYTAEWQVGDPSSITYNLNGGTWVENYTTKTLFTVEEEVELPDSSNIVRTGYDFTGWHEAENLEDDAVTKIEKGTYENKTFYASWTEGTVNYSVKHFIQTQDESGYDEKTEDEQLLTGTTNATTMAVAKSYEGYFAQKIEQKTINADGSTVVNIYYDRSYSIQYDLDGGENSEDNIECYTDKHLPLTLKEPSKAGFKFFGWVSENNELLSEISMDSREKISLKALWYQEGEAYYLVKHNLQSLEDENLYVFKEQNYCLGNVGTTASPTENNYSGFEKKTVENKTIGADGSTTVNINYSRKNYRVLFTVNYEDRKNSPSFTLEGRYQEKIVIPENSFSSEYIIDKCEPSTPTFFGDESSSHYEISLKSKYEYYLLGSEQVKIPVIYRDFRGYTEKGTGDGYITAEIANACRTPFEAGRGHPDFERMSGSGEEGLVATDLGEDGLPVFVKMHNENDITKESFDMWYRDVPGVNITIRDKELVFTRSNGSKRIYKYSSTNGSQGFFPIDNEGYGKTPGYNHNGGFTDEMTFYFTYNGDEEIYISGDDDIWVFINGKLAIDLGGLHAEKSSGITLDGKEITENGKTFKYNEKFNIVEDQKVEVKIFHAERCASGSNFTLRLTGLDMYERKLR